MEATVLALTIILVGTYVAVMVYFARRDFPQPYDKHKRIEPNFTDEHNAQVLVDRTLRELEIKKEY